MSFNKAAYISKFNKDTYKMYQFRVRKDNTAIINALDNSSNRNEYLVSLVDADVNKSILTIKQIKDIIKPILGKWGIKEIYLFGSYARGEARPDSDVDIYCDGDNVNTLHDLTVLEDELTHSLGKDVDLVFSHEKLHWYFKKQIERDLVKLC